MVKSCQCLTLPPLRPWIFKVGERFCVPTIVCLVWIWATCGFHIGTSDQDSILFCFRSATKHGIGVTLLRLPPAPLPKSRCCVEAALRTAITNIIIPVRHQQSPTPRVSVFDHNDSSPQAKVVSFAGYPSGSLYNKIKETETSRFTCPCLPFS